MSWRRNERLSLPSWLGFYRSSSFAFTHQDCRAGRAVLEDPALFWIIHNGSHVRHMVAFF
jgi:hypothetical protein